MNDQDMIKKIQKINEIRPDVNWKERTWQQLSARTAKHSWFSRVALVGSLSLIVLLGGSGALVAVAQNSVPGDQLYTVKLQAERLRLLSTPSPVKRAALEAHYSDRRIQEYTALVKREDGQSQLLTTHQREAAAQLTKTVSILGQELPNFHSFQELQAYEVLLQGQKTALEQAKRNLVGAKRQTLEQVQQELDRTIQKTQQLSHPQ